MTIWIISLTFRENLLPIQTTRFEYEMAFTTSDAWHMCLSYVCGLGLLMFCWPHALAYDCSCTEVQKKNGFSAKIPITRFILFLCSSRVVVICASTVSDTGETWTRFQLSVYQRRKTTYFYKQKIVCKALT